MSGRFPTDFAWGTATSAFQIEGGAATDGRGVSVWDTFAATPGRIEDASDARTACDHYSRWREDLDRLQWLGVGAYRFSIAWPRVLPAGRGTVNAAGLDFYDRLVDGLAERGIQAFVTLNHWDFPQSLQDAGGWAERDTVEAFVEYADVVSARLGDRVRAFTTHNEPWCIAHLGHEIGAHAPGLRDPSASLRVAHHLLLAHGRAMEVLRRNAPRAEHGIVLNLTPGVPASSSEADIDAARAFDGFFNRWYLDPLLRGAYPADAVADRVRQGHLVDHELPFVHDGDLAAIATPIDYLGVNFYSRVVMRGDPLLGPVPVPPPAGTPLTDMGWEIVPDELGRMLIRLHREYQVPCLYVTENGAAYSDAPDAQGIIDDRRRIDYLDAHLRAVQRALEDGAPVRGYFVWSLLDNFEWGHGYTKRFGLFWVDYATQARWPKNSAYAYRDLVAAQAKGAPPSFTPPESRP